MEENQRNGFSKGFSFLLGVGIFLTGLVSIAGIYFIIAGAYMQVWKETGMCEYVQMAIFYICVLCCFFFMLKIKWSQRFFSNLLVGCIQVIGALITGAAFLLPHLDGYRGTGFSIMRFSSFILLDGGFLLVGILFLIFARIIKEGFAMQQELDEVL